MSLSKHFKCNQLQILWGLTALEEVPAMHSSIMCTAYLGSVYQCYLTLVPLENKKQHPKKQILNERAGPLKVIYCLLLNFGSGVSEGEFRKRIHKQKYFNMWLW